MRVWIASQRDPGQTSLGQGLRRAQVELSAFDSGEAVEAGLMEGLPDALLVDRALPGAAGLLERLREGGIAPELTVVVVGEGTVEERIALFDRGADEVVPDGIEPRELVARLGRLSTRTSPVARPSMGELAIVDGLTEVHNRRYFLLRLADELRRAQRYDTPLALVVVDLDHFRGINDAAGHLAGDAILRTVARCVVGAVRETDTVARTGGDAFACILPQTHLAGALTVAERIRTDVAALRSGPTSELLLTASIGVGTHPAVSVHTADELIAVADRSLARAKEQGRNRVCLADPGVGGPARGSGPPMNSGG
jgi:two-component system, cell cycle response regulator